jgi:UDP-N-acetylglucosamine 2-epimerase (non-hydrolysing)
MKKRIAIILGTRPEAIKLIPVYIAFKKSDIFEPLLISTGQHKEMTDQIFQFFGVYPDVDLQIMVHNQSLSVLTSNLFLGLDELFKKYKLHYVAVQGDTTTAMVASMTAFYHRIKGIHIEAGLRTYDKFSPYPEEVNRKIISITSDIHFAPTEKAGEALKDEKASNVFVVGNTVIDSLIWAKKLVEERASEYFGFFSDIIPDFGGKIALVTGHRRESFGSGFENICDALTELADKYSDFTFVYPVHLNPNVKDIVYEKLANHKNIRLIDPLPYDRLIFLMSKAYIILTDSGGIQEEAPSMNVPLIVMRDTTERPEGIEAGCAVLCGANRIKIVKAFENIVNTQEVYGKMSSITNPYGDGSSSGRIVRICETLLQNE